MVRRPNLSYLQKKSRGPSRIITPDSTASFPLAVPFSTYIDGSQFQSRVLLRCVNKYLLNLCGFLLSVILHVGQTNC
ncbi:hypothetical protein ATANTOWER_029497 [Ataeniobius toweri]|uniref:Uncharacterized protein n=1 Tax=Ataeniobius toweri TaxID=208326 RepID=A0ABU7C108_9TELE|nr:hypothetical protein [Ataeniobius toweri]